MLYFSADMTLWDFFLFRIFNLIESNSTPRIENTTVTGFIRNRYNLFKNNNNSKKKKNTFIDLPLTR